MVTNVSRPIVSVICGTTGIILGICSANENENTIKLCLPLAEPIAKIIPADSAARKHDTYDQ